MASSNTQYGGSALILGTLLESSKIRSRQLDGGLVTHYALNGGKYYIKNEKEFFLALAHGLVEDRDPRMQRGKPVYCLVELKTPVFRMHLDLDFTDVGIIPLQDIIQLTRLLTTIMRSFYNCSTDSHAASQFKSVIMSAPAKVVPPAAPPKGGKKPSTMYKNGFHIIWPHLHVTTEQALRLRSACVSDVRSRLGHRVAPLNDWADVIDESVLKKNGLRIIGNDKCSKCPNCKTGCDVCNGRRVLFEHRPYWPVHVMNGDGGENEEDMRAIQRPNSSIEFLMPKILLCHTRLPDVVDPTSGYSPPLGAPGIEGEGATGRGKGKQTKKRNGVSNANTNRGNSVHAHLIDGSTEVFRRMQDFLQLSMTTAYKYVELRQFKYIASGNLYWCTLRGPGSLYCQNVRRDHTSSTVYFVVSEANGVYQRCYSKKGTCPQYIGPSIPLFASLHLALFVDKQHQAAPMLPSFLGLHMGPGAGVVKNVTRTTVKQDVCDGQILNFIKERTQEAQKVITAHVSLHKAQAKKQAYDKELDRLVGKPRCSEDASSVAETSERRRTAGIAGLTWRQLDMLPTRRLREVDSRIAESTVCEVEQMQNDIGTTYKRQRIENDQK